MTGMRMRMRTRTMTLTKTTTMINVDDALLLVLLRRRQQFAIYLVGWLELPKYDEEQLPIDDEEQQLEQQLEQRLRLVDVNELLIKV